jgi:hypothetical protein
VWTDPRSGNAEALAKAVTVQLGIEAAVIPALSSLASVQLGIEAAVIPALSSLAWG